MKYLENVKLTIAQVAEITGYSTTALRRWEKEGKTPTITKRHNQRAYTYKDIQTIMRFIESKEVAV